MAGGPEPTEAAERLHAQAIHLLRRLRREDGPAGLSAPQLSALSVVVHAGPLSVGELAAAEQVRPPTVTRLVRQLEEAALVERARSESDRRVVQVRATERGRRLLESGRYRRVAALAARLERLPPRELAVLVEGAAVLQRVLEERW